MKLSIIICAYNERRTILEAIQQAYAVELGAGWEKELIVVDNCSTDGTRELLQTVDLPNVHIIFQPRNMGKGTSVRTGIAASSGDYFVIYDADLEYEAADLARMVAEVQPGNTVAVFGSRTLGGRRIYEYAQNYWGVRFLTWVANVLYGAHLTDIAVGPKLVRLDVARQLNLRGTGFDLDFELPCKLLKRGYAIREVAIAYHPRTIEQGKKLSAPFRAGLHALWVILRTRFVD